MKYLEIGRLSFTVQLDATRERGFVGAGLTWVVRPSTVGVGLTIVCVTFSFVWSRERPWRLGDPLEAQP